MPVLLALPHWQKTQALLAYLQSALQTGLDRTEQHRTMMWNGWSVRTCQALSLKVCVCMCV